MCGTYDSLGHYVILNVSDTVMCMVLYETVSECGFSHIFTSKGRGGWLILNCAALLIFAFLRKLVKDMWDKIAVNKPPYPITSPCS